MKFWIPLLVALLSACVAPPKPVLAPVPASPKLETVVNLVFNRESYTAIRFLYDNVKDVEFVACLEAETHGSDLVVTEVVIPWQVGNVRDGITSFDCSGYPGTVHSHPIEGSMRVCMPSDADVRTFWSNPFLFIVVWCDTESFLWGMKDPTRPNEALIGGWNAEIGRDHFPVKPYQPWRSR